MYPRILSIQLAMMLLAGNSSLLLGRSLNDPNIIWTSILGAVTAFLVVDRFKLIELSGWVANLVSIFVLFYTMKDFVGGGSATKLISVANLLAYLQVVLLFQKKTPRLCWQIMVLSVLQVVVASIFNLNFESGWLFVIYFAVITVAMMLQNDFQQWTRVRSTNEKNKRQMQGLSDAVGRKSTANGLPFSMVAKLPAGFEPATGFRILAPWTLASLIFAFILFHSLPHTRQDLSDRGTSQFSGTGKSWQANLDEEGIVPQSNALKFRARFFDLRTDEDIILSNHPYFRGMAMSRLVLKNGKTSWEAPYDHVFAELSSYHRQSGYPTALSQSSDARPVGLEIIMEPETDPLLFAMMPSYRKPDSESEPEFCRDLSALTRRRSKLTNALTSYHYLLTTVIDSGNRPLSGWPYRSYFSRNSTGFRMELDSPEHRMLTEIDPDRYPELVRIATRTARQSPAASRVELCRALEDHFSGTSGYAYTIDFRELSRDESLDPVEDFVRNHKTGHCALYASALTLMLRSLDIPARYVVGYYGSGFNHLTDCYVVHGRQAHAWVEAYLPPEECTEEMMQLGIAGRGGAWLTLDPTPPIEFGSPNEAIDLARSIWQDYVISPDHNKQIYNGVGPLQKASLADSLAGKALESFVEFAQSSRLFQISLFAAVLMLIGYSTFRTRNPAPSRSSAKSSVSPVRRLAVKAVSVISGKLGAWVAGEQGEAIVVPFYQRLEKLLKKYCDLERESNQTHREFATAAGLLIGQRLQNDSTASCIPEMLQTVTDAFYQARFASIPLDKNALDVIENQIRSLEQQLKTRGKINR